MKAQRRHELKENDLAHAMEVARTYLDEHGGRIGLAVVIVVAVVAVTTLTVRSPTAAMEDKWRRKSELSYEDPEIGRESLAALATMTQEASDERFILTSLIELRQQASQWVRKVIGGPDPELNERERFILIGLIEQGQQALRLAQKVIGGPDPELNEQAREAFEQLRTRFSDHPLAIGIAHLGLATVAENDFALDSDPAHKMEAVKHLETVLEYPGLDSTPFKRMALERREALDQTFALVSFNYLVPVETPADGDPVDADPADTP